MAKCANPKCGHEMRTYGIYALDGQGGLVRVCDTRCRLELADSQRTKA